MALTTPEDARISELARMIDAEEGSERLAILAAELEHLLTLRLERQKQLPPKEK